MTTIIDSICDRTALMRELEADEGRASVRYKCPAGHWTIGIGHNLESGHLPLGMWNELRQDYPHLRNALLDDHVLLTDAQIVELFEVDIEGAIAALDLLWPKWRDLAEVRKRALINLSFQLGAYRFRQFRRFWAELEAARYLRAADELVDSLWYRQTQPSRTARVVAQMRFGE